MYVFAFHFLFGAKVCLDMSVRKKRGACSFSVKLNKACCSHKLLSGCPEVPLWLRGGCFVVANWAGPRRADVILGKACFLPLSCSVCCYFLILPLYWYLWSPSVEKVCRLLLIKRERQCRPFLLSFCRWVSCVCRCLFCISPPDHISFNTIAFAQHKLVELVLQGVLRLSLALKFKCSLLVKSICKCSHT